MSKLILLLILISPLNSSLRAEESLSEMYNSKSFAITFENDVFTYKIRDRYYTNGVFFTYKNNYEENSDSFIYKNTNELLDFSLFKDDLENPKNSFQVLLAQLMITPDDITESDLDLNDQPYAGILYLQADIFAIYKNQSQAISIKMGVSGPESGAEYMQDAVHELIGNEAPEGWELQVPKRLFVNLSFQTNYRPYRKDFDYFSFDTTLNWGLDLGNLETAARAGFLLFLYKKNSGNSLLDPSYGTSQSRVNFNRSNFLGFSLFTGASLTGIAYSLINNSDFIYENYLIIPTPYIINTAIGFAYGFKYFSIEFSYFAQTKEFSTQSYNPVYGSIRLTGKF